MSGPDAPGDDVDDVTLWAGRLRAWPTAPQMHEVDDATVRSPRPVRGAEHESPERAVDPVDDTLLVRPGGRRRDEPPGAVADRAFAEDALDEATAPSRSIRRRAASRRGQADGAAVRSGRDAGASRGGPDGAGTEDDLARGDHDPVAREGFAAVPDERDPARDGLRGVDVTDGDAGGDGVAAAGSADDESLRDNTAAGSRDRRRPPVLPPIDDGPGGAREARSPDALRREAYAPRVDAPVRVARAAAAPRSSATDATAARPRRVRGGTRLLLLVAVMVVVVGSAAIGLALLLG